jgi:hypothetical protein
MNAIHNTAPPVANAETLTELPVQSLSEADITVSHSPDSARGNSSQRKVLQNKQNQQNYQNN